MISINQVKKDSEQLFFDALPKAAFLALKKCSEMDFFSPSDIALTKIIAISQRGKKRNLFDLYWISQNVEPLHDSISKIHKQYSINQNLTHILKSLVYFEDAENDPEPEVYFKATWAEVKKFFKKEVLMVTKKIMKL